MASPTLPAAATKPTAIGASAFFEYFWATYNYAFATLDSEPLRAVSAPTCKTCAGYADGVDEIRSRGGRLEGGDVVVLEAVTAPGEASDGLVVNALVNQAAATTVASDGSRSEPAPAKASVRVDAAVRWQSGRWVMVGMDFKG